MTSENGTRNFTDALNQSAYRTRARLRRNASVSRPTTIANSVDCQR